MELTNIKDIQAQGDLWFGCNPEDEPADVVRVLKKYHDQDNNLIMGEHNLQGQKDGCVIYFHAQSKIALNRYRNDKKHGFEIFVFEP